MNILSEFKALKDKLAGFMADQSKATLATLTDFSTKLSTLETGALAKLDDANAKVTDLTGKVATLETKANNAQAALDGVNVALTSALAALKIEVKADASATDKVTALQTGVSNTLAKLNVKPGDVPAPAAASTAMDAAAAPKTKTRVEFEKLAPKARMEFLRAGGTLID